MNRVPVWVLVQYKGLRMQGQGESGNASGNLPAGETIICCEVSRLSRSTQQLCKIINIIKAKHLRLEILGSITICLPMC